MEERIASLAMVSVHTIRLMAVLLSCLLGLMLGAGLNVLAARYAVALKYAFPFGQLAASFSFALMAYHYGLKPELIVGFWFCAILIVIVQTDLSAMIIPDQVVLIGATGAVLLRVWSHPLPWWEYVAGSAVGSGFLLLVAVLGGRLLGKETMGGGDIKLYLFIGLVLGIKLTLLSLFLSSVVGFIGGVVQLVRTRIARSQVGQVHGIQAAVRDKTEPRDAAAIPFGPYIAIGSLAAYLWGEKWIAAYWLLFV